MNLNFLRMCKKFQRNFKFLRKPVFGFFWAFFKFDGTVSGETGLLTGFPAKSEAIVPKTWGFGAIAAMRFSSAASGRLQGIPV
jgi:hypothetical protein